MVTFARTRGFTIIEMLIAVGVLSLLLALVAPSLTTLMSTQQLKTAAQDVYASLSVARSEALTRNTSVTVEPLDGDWARGWTITAAGGTVIRRQDAYRRIAFGGPARVVFNGDGRPDSIAVPFSLTAGDVANDHYRCVRLRLNGRSSMSSGAC